MRRTSLKRTSFKAARPQVSEYHAQREERLAARASRAVATAAPSDPRVRLGPAATTPAPKAPAPVRSEAYRRLVAALPCAYCGIEGYSQHAHQNDPESGKAASRKADDRCGFALCCARIGHEGHHAAFDQYRLLPGGREAHHAQGRAWAEQTRELIYQSGQWPAKLPLWQGGSDAL